MASSFLLILFSFCRSLFSFFFSVAQLPEQGLPFMTSSANGCLVASVVVVVVALTGACHWAVVVVVVVALTGAWAVVEAVAAAGKE